ncbi:MAG TPA: DUF4340 domain-containing protein [Steroidobacteraceae bacterium]|nr:DUF4340 domain-containing protein [Steroidobacteraceae bacterium]
MSRHRFTVLVVVALVAIAAAFYVSTLRDASHETPGLPLLPALPGDLNAVTAVTVRKGSATPTLTLHKAGDQWSVAERGDYPADVSKLRQLLVTLRDARIVEAKTADPARFAQIGVEDPVDPGAAGAEVTVQTAGGKTAVIVGKAVGNGNFVRRQGENRAYSAEPSITVETEPRFWIDARLIDVAATLIQSIEYKPAAGAAFTLHRLTPADNTFSLDGVPPGRKAKDGHALAPSPSLLTGLNAEDVAAASTLNFASPAQVTVTLTDGKILTLTGTVAGDKHWIQVTSNKDAVLNAKTRGRAFEIASYRYDEIFKPLEQLLEPLPQKTPAAPKGAAKKAPAAAPKQPTEGAAPPHAKDEPAPAATP